VDSTGLAIAVALLPPPGSRTKSNFAHGRVLFTEEDLPSAGALRGLRFREDDDGMRDADSDDNLDEEVHSGIEGHEKSRDQSRSSETSSSTHRDLQFRPPPPNRVAVDGDVEFDVINSIANACGR